MLDLRVKTLVCASYMKTDLFPMETRCVKPTPSQRDALQRLVIYQYLVTSKGMYSVVHVSFIFTHLLVTISNFTDPSLESCIIVCHGRNTSL